MALVIVVLPIMGSMGSMGSITLSRARLGRSLEYNCKQLRRIYSQVS